MRLRMPYRSMQHSQRAHLERGQLGLQALLELLHVADAQREQVQQRRQVALLLGAHQGPPRARPRALERRLDLRRLLVAQQGRTKGPDACSGMLQSAQESLKTKSCMRPRANNSRCVICHGALTGYHPSLAVKSFSHSNLR